MYWAHGFCPLRAYSVVEQTDKEQGTKFIQNRASYRLLSVLWEMKQDLREYKFGGEGYLAWCSKKTQAVGGIGANPCRTSSSKVVISWSRTEAIVFGTCEKGGEWFRKLEPRLDHLTLFKPIL